MKKSILIVAMIIMFSSCRKNRVCTCTTTSDAAGVYPVTTVIDTPKETKRKAREETCANTKTTSNGVTTLTTCKVE